jgi:hypothetical protein
MTQPLPARTMRQPGYLVYAAGVGTSLLALWIVQLCQKGGENPMGWYVNGILPAGALLVGIVSGLGYALASRYFNVKLTKAFVLGMLVTGLVDYAAMQWFAYTSLLEEHHATSDMYSFVQYLRDLTEHMRFSSSHGSDSTELGVGGYFFKLLEVAGFAGGTMIPSAVLFKLPYCTACQRYLKEVQSAYLRSNATRGDIFALPRKQRPAAIAQSAEEVVAKSTQILQAAASLSLADTRALLQTYGARSEKEAIARIELALKKCPDCETHRLSATLHYTGADKKPARRAAGAIDKIAPARAAAA